MQESTKGLAGPQSAPKRRFLNMLLACLPAAAVPVTTLAALPLPAPRSAGPLVRDWNGELWVVLQANVRENLYGGGVSPDGRFYLCARPDGGPIFGDAQCRRILMHRNDLRQLDGSHVHGGQHGTH